MLVLTRKRGESIHIGDGIVITILDVRPSRTRIGINAPSSVRVRRDEVLHAAHFEMAIEAVDTDSARDELHEDSVKTRGESGTLGGFQSTKVTVARI